MNVIWRGASVGNALLLVLTTVILFYMVCHTLFYLISIAFKTQLHRFNKVWISKLSIVSICLNNYNWLPARQRIAHKILILTFNAYHKIAPHYMPRKYNKAVGSNNSFALVHQCLS